jgi:hypothetical protein
METSSQVKEEFYVRRLFDDDVPVFVDATRYARQEIPYPLSAKKSLKATCAVRLEGEVVAFSLRGYTAKQAEREVEHIESVAEDRPTSYNVLRPRMPRRILHELVESARSLAGVLGNEVVVEHDDTLYVLELTRLGAEGGLRLAGKLVRRPDGGYDRGEIAEGDTEFELPVAGVRLRVFLRSPIRDRILAYAFGGYLTRRPGEIETVTRAAALALNSLLGLATFRMLSGLRRIAVPPRPSGVAVPERTPEERVLFDVPVLLFTEDETPAARGPVTAEIDLDRVDPVTGGLQLHLRESDRLEWNPVVAGTVAFESYHQVLTETAASVVHSILGEDAVRDVAYDIMLSEVGEGTITQLRAATKSMPALVAKPTQAEVRQAPPNQAPQLATPR